jgi:hypothetical protein
MQVQEDTEVNIRTIPWRIIHLTLITKLSLTVVMNMKLIQLLERGQNSILIPRIKGSFSNNEKWYRE